MSSKAGKTLPWVTVRRAIDDALKLRLIERSEDSGPWPCGYPQAGEVILAVPSETPTPPDTRVRDRKPIPYGAYVAESELRPDEIQSLAEFMGDLLKEAAGLDLKFKVQIQVSSDGAVPDDRVAALNEVLAQVSEDVRLGR